MALFEVIVQTEYYGQQCINRFNYVSSGTPANVTLSYGCAYALGFILPPATVDFNAGTLAAAWQNLVADDVKFIQIQVKNVYDPVDFYLTPFPVGVVGKDNLSEALSPYVSYGFKSNRTRLDIRPGSKRFAGVTENAVQGGGIITAAALPALGVMAAALDAEPTFDDSGNTLTYAQVIVSKEPYITPSGKTAYRYYATEAEQLTHVMGSVTWTNYAQTRSQVSRQYGKGV